MQTYEKRLRGFGQKYVCLQDPAPPGYALYCGLGHPVFDRPMDMTLGLHVSRLVLTDGGAKAVIVSLREKDGLALFFHRYYVTLVTLRQSIPRLTQFAREQMAGAQFMCSGGL